MIRCMSFHSSFDNREKSIENMGNESETEDEPENNITKRLINGYEIFPDPKRRVMIQEYI